MYRYSPKYVQYIVKVLKHVQYIDIVLKHLQYIDIVLKHVQYIVIVHEHVHYIVLKHVQYIDIVVKHVQFITVQYVYPAETPQCSAALSPAVSNKESPIIATLGPIVRGVMYRIIKLSKPKKREPLIPYHPPPIKNLDIGGFFFGC